MRQNVACNPAVIHNAGEGTPKNEKEGRRWINEHRVAHLHHDHHPQMMAWRRQAARTPQPGSLAP